MSSANYPTETRASHDDPANSDNFDQLNFVRPLLATKPDSWSGIKLVTFQLLPVEAFYYSLADELIILLHLANPLKVEWEYNGKKHQGYSQPGNIFLMPVGSQLGCRWAAIPTVALVALHPNLLVALASDISTHDPHNLELNYPLNAPEMLVQQLILALLTELETVEDWGRVYAESLTQTLALHLIRHYSNLSTNRKLPGRRLTSSQLLHIQDYIYDRIDRDISLLELAEAVGLSQFHFTRLFKGATGLSPHQFVLQHRVERAKEMLLQGRNTIAEIAQQTGFADQSHLTRHFKRHFGISPKIILTNSKNLPK